MKSGYSIYWTEYALSELAEVFDYLENNWTEKELSKLSNEIENTLRLISRNPKIFQKSELNDEIRRAVILKYNSLYYWEKNNRIEILSFFSNRKNPKNMML